MRDQDPLTTIARQRRVIDVLIRRVETLENSDRGGRLSQQVELERIVSLKTRELADEKQKLAETLQQLSEMQGQLVQAQKLEAMGHLAAGIAHEINTPIQFISDNMTFLSEAFADLLDVASEGAQLADGDGDPARVLAAADEADLDYLQKSVPTAFVQCADGLRRVSAIVSSMKRLSHPASGSTRPVDLNASLQATIVIARPEYRDVADVVVELEALPMVSCVELDLNQVFLNLIVNAAHAIADKHAGKGTITVRTHADADAVSIEIADTGTGIPDHVLAKMYDPFFTTKEVGRGTGQGLSIARAIVRKHGGDLSCSTTPGEGTRFTVQLPLNSAAA